MVILSEIIGINFLVNVDSIRSNPHLGWTYLQNALVSRLHSQNHDVKVFEVGKIGASDMWTWFFP